MALCLYGLPPKKHINYNLMRKTSEIKKTVRDILFDQYSSKLSSSSKTRTSEKETVPANRSLRRHDN